MAIFPNPLTREEMKARTADIDGQFGRISLPGFAGIKMYKDGVQYGCKYKAPQEPTEAEWLAMEAEVAAQVPPKPPNPTWQPL